MRFLFHAMLGFSIGVVGTGLVYGTVVHERLARDGTRGHGAHARDVLAQAQARVPLEMTITPPLPMFPRYGEPVAPGATLAWHLLDGTDGALVEISSTPTFEPGTIRRLEVDGETVKLPPWLGAGMWFWRLRGRQGDVTGEKTTSTWMLDVVVPASEPAWG
jgi:hypothetical protein